MTPGESHPTCVDTPGSREVTRRQLLATVGVGTTTLLTACLSDGADSSPEPDRLNGEWILRGRIVNEDTEPREWRVESRSQDGQSVGAAWATVPAGESWEFELRGQLFDEQREVYVESEGGSASESWRPTDCRRLFVRVTTREKTPRVETECLQAN